MERAIVGDPSRIFIQSLPEQGHERWSRQLIFILNRTIVPHFYIRSGYIHFHCKVQIDLSKTEVTT